MASGRPETDYFAIRYQPDRSRSMVWREIIRALRHWLPEEGDVVELGPGYCDFINQLSARRKVAIDIHPESRRYAAGDVEFALGDGNELQWLGPSSMDLVFASNFLEHLERTQATAVLDAAMKVLKPGGRVILIQPNFRYSYDRYFDDHTHLTPYTHTGLCALLQSRGFRIVACKPRFLPLAIDDGSWIPRHGWIVRLYLRSPLRPLARQMLVVAEKFAGNQR